MNLRFINYFEAQNTVLLKKEDCRLLKVEGAAYIENGIEYEYPSGNKSKDMNTQDLLKINKHQDVTKLNQLNELLLWGGMFGNGLMILKEIIH